MRAGTYLKNTLVLTLLVALPVRAALFDDDEARKRIDGLRGRVDALEQSTRSRLDALEAVLKNQGLVDLFRDVEQIKFDLAKLRGQYEVATYELDQAQKRQRDLYVDLDTRLRRLEAGPGNAAPASGAPGMPGSAGTAPAGALSPAPAGAPSSMPAGAPFPASAGVPANTGGTPGLAGGAGQAPRGAGGSAFGPAPPLAAAPPAGAHPGGTANDVAAEQRTYDSALDQFKSGNFGTATASFQAFVRTYPRSPLAASAMYWAGNAQYAQRDFRSAIASQRQLLTTYPDSQKVPDALLNIASSQVEMGDTAAARRTLEEIVAKHAGTEAAAKARQRLAGGR